jgi:hypothetical protein
LVTESTPSSVAADGGVFIAHEMVEMVYWIVVLLGFAAVEAAG